MTETPGRWRLRFSLLTLLLLLTIAALAVTVWRQSFEIEPLRQEVRRLRQEVGQLTIDDESKIYAIRVITADLDVHRFRVYLPKNRRFNLNTRNETIPGKLNTQSRQEWFASLPGSGSSGNIDSGEFTIDVQVRPDPKKPDHWDFAYSINGRGGGTTGAVVPWLADRRVWTISDEVHRGKQIELDANDGLVLFALRKGDLKEFPGGYSTTGPDESKEHPGLMLWIEPVP